MNTELRAKYDKLRNLLRESGGVIIGFSGGVDSTLLAKVGAEVLGPRALAVTVTTVMHPAFELAEAVALAQLIGIRHRALAADPLAIEQVADNPLDRCYHCKRAIFSRLLALAQEEGLAIVADGSNVDDVGAYRPGVKALQELGIRSPLREAALGKAEIRELSRELGLPTWDKPALACLATRIPYGERLTPERLRRIDAAEQFLRELGVRQVRVRDYGATARLELDPSDFPKIMEDENRTRVVAALGKLGYDNITLDLAGYRSGTMDRQREVKSKNG